MSNMMRNKYEICNLFSEQKPNSTQLPQAQQTRQFNIQYTIYNVLQKYA
jgi:hypothetical protein